MKKTTYLLLTFLTLSITAICQDAASPIAWSTLSRSEKDSVAKQLTPAPGKALVYVIRTAWQAIFIKMGVRVDGVHIGGTKPSTYVFTMMTPGTHTITSTSENHAKEAITVEAGKTYYVRQEVLDGVIWAETDLTILADQQGQKDLQTCTIAKDCVAAR